MILTLYLLLKSFSNCAILTSILTSCPVTWSILRMDRMVLNHWSQTLADKRFTLRTRESRDHSLSRYKIWLKLILLSSGWVQTSLIWAMLVEGWSYELLSYCRRRVRVNDTWLLLLLYKALTPQFIVWVILSWVIVVICDSLLFEPAPTIELSLIDFGIVKLTLLIHKNYVTWV